MSHPTTAWEPLKGGPRTSSECWGQRASSLTPVLGLSLALPSSTWAAPGLPPGPPRVQDVWASPFSRASAPGWGGGPGTHSLSTYCVRGAKTDRHHELPVAAGDRQCPGEGHGAGGSWVWRGGQDTWQEGSRPGEAVMTGERGAGQHSRTAPGPGVRGRGEMREGGKGGGGGRGEGAQVGCGRAGRALGSRSPCGRGTEEGNRRGRELTVPLPLLCSQLSTGSRATALRAGGSPGRGRGQLWRNPGGGARRGCGQEVGWSEWAGQLAG